MQLQPGTCPFPVLEFWGKMTMPNAGIMAYRRDLPSTPGSRVLSKEQRKTGCSCILSAGMNQNTYDPKQRVGTQGGQIRGATLVGGFANLSKHALWPLSLSRGVAALILMTVDAPQKSAEIRSSRQFWLNPGSANAG